jgi:hypothetical protein
MRYKIFLSNSISALEDEQLIGGADSYKEACQVIKDYLSVNNFHQEPYWRILMDSNATFIDYGSWSKFIAIVPPISQKDFVLNS